MTERERERLSLYERTRDRKIVYMREREIQFI